MSFHWKHKPSMHPKSSRLPLPPQPLLPLPPPPPLFLLSPPPTSLIVVKSNTNTFICLCIDVIVLSLFSCWSGTNLYFPFPLHILCSWRKDVSEGSQLSFIWCTSALASVAEGWQLFFCGVCYQFSRHILMLVYGALLCSS